MKNKNGSALGTDDMIAAFRKWLEVREEEGIEHPGIWQLCADIDHSSLLKRLVEGEKFFDVPPPRSYSYPWYDVLEKEEVSDIFEVYESKHDGQFFTQQGAVPGETCKDILYIDQGPWKIIEKHNDEDYVVVYSMGHGVKHRWSDTQWRVFTKDGKWNIKRIK